MSNDIAIQKDLVFVGGDLALDFVNSKFGTGSAHQDYFVDDAAVLAWLKAAEVVADDVGEAPEGLRELACQLRDNTQLLLDNAKLGQGADATTVNRVLERGRASQVLRWNKAGKSFELERVPIQKDAPSLLEPVARAVVTLLTDTPLESIRQCEAHDCTLRFLDKTKSHRRRWCSMAMCGNRMKVAAYRRRSKSQSA